MLRIEDETARRTGACSMTATHGSRRAWAWRTMRHAGSLPLKMHWQTTVELAGRRWGLHFAPTLAVSGHPTELATMEAVLGSGLAFVESVGSLSPHHHRPGHGH